MQTLFKYWYAGVELQQHNEVTVDQGSEKY
jgi:hypothetical protein